MKWGVKWRTYVDRIFEEKEKALNVAFKAQQEALNVATVSLDRELEHLNKLREEVIQERSRYSTKEEFVAELKRLDTEINVIKDTLDGVNLSLQRDYVRSDETDQVQMKTDIESLKNDRNRALGFISAAGILGGGLGAAAAKLFGA